MIREKENIVMRPCRAGSSATAFIFLFGLFLLNAFKLVNAIGAGPDRRVVMMYYETHEGQTKAETCQQVVQLLVQSALRWLCI